MRFLYTILDIVFPIKCLGCGQNGTDLCIKCLAEAPEAERESASWIFPIYDYRHPSIKKAVGALKYKGKRKIAEIFAEVLYSRILEELADLKMLKNFEDSVLIPIPLSLARYKERGYNQTELIGRALNKLDGNKNFKIENNLLVKNKETIHQAHIKDRSQRLKNLVGSFSVVSKNLIQNKNIILIDDVTTTGATLTEARKVLKQNGAKNVIAFTVAH